MNETYREEAKKWEALYDEVYDALSNEIDRDSQGELETLGQCAKRIIKERNEFIVELKEYRSIAENVGAKKAVSEKEKAIRERGELIKAIKKWYKADNKKSLVQFRKHYAHVRKEVQDIVKQQDKKKSLITQNI